MTIEEDIGCEGWLEAVSGGTKMVFTDRGLAAVQSFRSNSFMLNRRVLRTLDLILILICGILKIEI